MKLWHLFSRPIALAVCRGKLSLSVLLLSLTLPSPARAQFDYSVEDGAATITGYSGPGGDLLIPATIDGLPVIGIGWWAFAENNSITGVTIPDGVTAIRDGAFYNCTGLVSVSIPSSMTWIEGLPFYGCTNLAAITVEPGNPLYSSRDGVLFDQAQTTLIQCPAGRVGKYEIPDSVISLGYWAFFGCSSLTHVTIPASATVFESPVFQGCISLNAIEVDAQNPAYSSIEGVLFNQARTTLIEYPRGKPGSYVVPDSVTNIGFGAFSGCTGLTTLTIPASVTNIGGGAFSGAVNLDHITIPNSVAIIENGLFSGCTGLTQVMLPDSITSIGGWAFSGCSSLMSLLLPDSVSIIGESAFSGCASLKDFLIPNNVNSIEFASFDSCSNLTSMTIPHGVTNIGPWAFRSCSSLTDITIPGSVASLGDFAFEGCSSLTSSTLLEGVSHIGNGAFANCTSLQNLTLVASVVFIGDYAFVDCANLLTITLPQNLASIGDLTFRNCVNLTEVVIPNTVTNIGFAAFSGCTSLTSITIPAGVTTIMRDAFYGCTSLLAIEVDTANAWYSSVDGVLFSKDRTTLVQCPGAKAGNFTVPESVNRIQGAFDGCLYLTAITVEAGNITYSSRDGVLFDLNQTNLTRCPEGRQGEYTIPDGVTSLGAGSFRGCINLTSVTAPATLASIRDSAFTGCSGLSSIYFQGDAPVLQRSLGVLFATIYYLPETSGWDRPFAGRPTVLWDPRIVTDDGRFGVQAGQFGFNIAASSVLTIVVQASPSLTDPAWASVSTNTLVEATSYFSDPVWETQPQRVYRLRSH